MNMPMHIRTKPNQVAILAWVVLQINVALLGTDFGMSADRKNRAENCKGDGQQSEAWGNRESKPWQDEIADRGGNVHRLVGSPTN
jgi:hypothetical protein